jgi:peptide alpha-N-acetyltransferase
MMESGCEEVCQVLVGVPFGLYSSKCSIIHTTISQRKYGFFILKALFVLSMVPNEHIGE